MWLPYGWIRGIEILTSASPRWGFLNAASPAIRESYILQLSPSHIIDPDPKELFSGERNVHHFREFEKGTKNTRDSDIHNIYIQKKNNFKNVSCAYNIFLM